MRMGRDLSAEEAADLNRPDAAGPAGQLGGGDSLIKIRPTGPASCARYILAAMIVVQLILFAAILLSSTSFGDGKSVQVNQPFEQIIKPVYPGTTFNLKLKEGTLGFENALQLTYQREDGKMILQGQLGVSLPTIVGQPTSCPAGPGGEECFQYGDYAKLQYLTTGNCTHFEWQSLHARRLEDCFDLLPNAHWYGGGETYYQAWPIERETRREAPVVTGDSLAGQEYGSLTESYWVVSTGAAIHASEDTPLFMSWRSVHAGKVCFVAKNEHPYPERNDLTLKYDICVGDNIKSVHRDALSRFYPKVTGAPDLNMTLYPFWSTWAQFHADVDQTKVIEYAQRVVSEGFRSSHMEIDDDWETCYGEREFNLNKFPDPRGMVQQLNAMNFRTTVWMHPFINFNCPQFKEAIDGKFFVQDDKGKAGITSWWTGTYRDTAGTIDFTNPAAIAWWNSRLQKLKTDIGIDSFKFDAGETNWLPYSHNLNTSLELQPNIYTTKYVEAVAEYGGMIEVRSGRRTQHLPIFTRMLDKDSRWGYDNGLQSLIPTLLHFGVLGYPFVLPDMIGGNAYQGRPSPELYIRWMQANAFMPSVQFSLVPWDFGAEALRLTKAALALREQYKDLIVKAVNQAVMDGSPINRPMWWIDPEDEATYMIDNQYVLGDDMIVAPVLIEGAVSRDIYLPRGTWESNAGVVHTGPIRLQNYAAPLDVLPYFVSRASQ